MRSLGKCSSSRSGLSKALLHQPLPPKATPMAKGVRLSSLSRCCAVFAAQLLLVACQSGIRSDLQNQTIGELIDSSGLRPEQMGISVEKSATASVTVAKENTQAALERSTDDAIDHYDKVVSVEAQPAVRAESLRRSADLRIERAEQLQIDGVGGASTQLHAAIEAYQTLLGDYRDYTNRAQVYYQLARAYELSGDSERTIHYLLAASEAPYSGDIASEAQFRAAELLVQAKRYQQATEVYSAVLLDENTEYSDIALYKRGWSFYQLADYQAALADMGVLFEQLLAGETTTAALPGLASLTAEDAVSPIEMIKEENREMARDAMRLSVLSLAADTSLLLQDSFTTPSALRFRDDIYHQLGDYLLEKERYTDAADVYRGMVTVKGPSVDSAPYMDKAIASLEAGGFATLAITAREDYIDLFEPLLVSEQGEGGESGATDEVAENWVRYCLDIAAWRHKEAKETPETEADTRASRFLVAAGWHAKLLDKFPNHAEAAQTAVYYGDALYNAGDLQSAALAYARAGYQYPDFEGAADAALASVKSYRALLDLGDAPSDAGLRSFFEASQRFVDHYPGHKDATSVQLGSLNVLYSEEQYEALISASATVLKNPALSEGQRAELLAMVAESNVTLQQYSAAEQAFAKLLALESIAGTARADQVRERQAFAVYRYAETLRDSGQAQQRTIAADKLLEVVALSQDESIRESALYDAAVLRYELEQWRDSAALLARFITMFPSSDLVPDARGLIASAYEEDGNYAAAAEAYRRIAMQQKVDREIRFNASLKAADLYRRDNNIASLLLAYEEHLEHFPEPVDQAQRIRWQLVEILDEGGALDSQGYRRQLENIVAVDQQNPDLPEDSRLIAAQSSLALARIDIQRAREIALKQPLKASLARRRSAMDEAIAALDRASQYQFASVSTAASHELGMLYLDFAKALLQSDRPSGLKNDVLAEYSMLLEEQAFPFEEKAIAVFEENLSRLYNGIWNTELRKSLAALTQLEPARYRKQPKLEAVYDALR